MVRRFGAFVQLPDFVSQICGTFVLLGMNAPWSSRSKRMSVLVGWLADLKLKGEDLRARAIHELPRLGSARSEAAAVLRVLGSNQDSPTMPFF